MPIVSKKKNVLLNCFNRFLKNNPRAPPTKTVITCDREFIHSTSTFNSKSRTVPPPKAAIKAMMKPPRKSRFLSAAVSIPLIAKNNTPTWSKMVMVNSIFITSKKTVIFVQK